MTPERWARIRELFDAALELQPTARARFLSEATYDDPSLAPEVMGLLASDLEAEAFLSTPARPTSSGDSLAAPGPSLLGRHIGPYRVLGEIGQGGMGTVYRAVRDDDQYHKQVAIKLVRGGMDAELVLQRFKAERQILANLEHANIARLIDGGSTEEGWPYFSMEYVEGQPIDRYCASLGVRERLELFRAVCAAVQHAHQHLVIHRDLKPSNIFVTADGVPKLLDFGIARLLGADAAGPGEAMPSMGWPLMTPEYASPEQVKGEAMTTASDVYSLGMLLYLLLARQRAYEIKTRAPEEVARVVCQQQPEKPSAVADRPLSRQLRGDLDTIVLKAIRKEPARRYQTVGELSEDIRRHLAGLPVQARGDTLAYRAGKFMGRHKPTVVVAGLLVASLLGGIVATLRQARIAEANRARAERRFDDVRRLANIVLFDVHGALANVSGALVARQLLVETALRYLDDLAREAGDEPALLEEVASGYERIAEIQGMPEWPSHGRSSDARTSLERALGLRRRAARGARAGAGARAAEARLLTRIGSVLAARGETGQALARHREASAILADLNAGSPSPQVRLDLAIVQVALGDDAWELGDLGAAANHYQEALVTAAAARGAEPGSVAAIRQVGVIEQRLGDAAAERKDWQAALAHHRASLAVDEELSLKEPQNAEIDRDLGTDLSRLGADAFELKDFPQALAAHERARELRERLRAAEPGDARALSDAAESRFEAARTLLALGRRAEALAEASVAVERWRSLVELDADNARWWDVLAGALTEIGRWETARGRRAAARARFEEAREIRLRLAAERPDFAANQKALEAVETLLEALREGRPLPNAAAGPPPRPVGRSQLCRSSTIGQVALHVSPPMPEAIVLLAITSPSAWVDVRNLKAILT